MKKKNKQTERFISTEIKKQTYRNEDYQKVISFFIILVIVGGFIGILYFVTGKYVTKDSFQDETTTTEIKYDSTAITINKMFRMSDSNYMVMIYDKNDKADDMLFSPLVQTYNGGSKLYRVDLSDGMNKKYFNKDGKENKTPSKAEEVVITQPTLIKFSNGKVVDFITDEEQIRNTLK